MKVGLDVLILHNIGNGKKNVFLRVYPVGSMKKIVFFEFFNLRQEHS